MAGFGVLVFYLKPEQIGSLYCVLYASTFSSLFPCLQSKYNPLNGFHDPLRVFNKQLEKH